MPAAAIRPPLFSKGTALGRARFPLTAFGTRLGDASRTVRRPVACRNPRHLRCDSPLPSNPPMTDPVLTAPAGPPPQRLPRVQVPLLPRRPGRRPDRKQRGPGHGVDRGGASWRPEEGDGGAGGFGGAELAGADGSPSLTGAVVRGSAAGSPRSGAGSVHWQVKAGSRAGFMVCGGIASDHPASPPRCSHSRRTAPLHAAARFVGACAPWRSGSCSTTSTRRLGSPMSLPAPPSCDTLGRIGCCSGTGNRPEPRHRPRRSAIPARRAFEPVKSTGMSLTSRGICRTGTARAAACGGVHRNDARPDGK